MSASEEQAATRYVRSDDFLCAARSHVPVAVRKVHHGIGVCDVHPLGLRSGWIEADPKRFVQTARVNLCLLDAAVGSKTAKHHNFSRCALREEYVAIGRGTNQAGIVESIGVQLYAKTRRGLRPGIPRTRDQCRTAVHGRRRVGIRQVSKPNVVDCPRRLRPVVGKRGQVARIGASLRWEVVLSVAAGAADDQQQRSNTLLDDHLHKIVGARCQFHPCDRNHYHCHGIRIVVCESSNHSANPRVGAGRFARAAFDL